MKLINLFIGLVITIVLFILDRITKKIAKNKFRNNYENKCKVIKFTYLENDGAMMGILKNAKWLLILISIVAILLICIFLVPTYVYHAFTFYSVFIMIFLAGALGNFYDRIFYRYVIDFIYIKIKNKSSAVFNLADLYIFIGVVGMMIGAIYYGI